MVFRNFIMVAMVTIFLAVCGFSLNAQELKSQETCPVTGKPIDKGLYVAKDGKRMYMCCPGCKAKIEQNFEKYETDLKEKGEKLKEDRDD